MIEQRWVVGTGEDCGVRVEDEYASTRHCEVARLDDGTYAVRDLGSLNGTHIGTVVENAVGEVRMVKSRIHDWTAIRPGQTLVVGRSEIPWHVEVI